MASEASSSHHSPMTMEATRENKFENDDVFLSHRGPDMKSGFVGFLYEGLKRHGLQPYLDHRSTVIGEECWNSVEDRIKNAPIAVVVFSERYAESEWCLKELHVILEAHPCKEILPVFYNVKPWDLRNPERSQFRDGFEKLKKRFDSNLIEQWKADLEVVSKLRGWEHSTESTWYSNRSTSSEVELVAKIVDRVLELANKSMPLDVGEHVVGVKEVAEKLIQCQLFEKEVSALGLLGMGGIGKSTLAKELYNQLCKRFEASCYVEDVTAKIIQGDGVVEIQKQMLENLCSSVIDNDNKLKLKPILERRLSKKKILVVLDDVSNVEMLNSIMTCKMLNKGSVCIVTSRDKRVFESSNIFEPIEQEVYVHEVKMLNLEDSKRVFTSFAFGRDGEMRPKYEALATKISELCCGVPLVLKVCGAHLRGEVNLDVWEDVISKLNSGGMKEDERGRFTMHDHLGDMGRKIERVEAGDSTRRLWMPESLSLLKERKALGAAGNLAKPGNIESPTSSKESLDQAQHDPMESLEKLKKARGVSDRSTLTMLRTWQPPIAITALLGTVLLLWRAYFTGGHEPSFTFYLLTSTILLGVCLLVLVLEMRRSVHLRLLWYNTMGKSLRPCNMLKAQYYSQNLRGALFISKDAPDGCWSYHPDFSLTGQRRENDRDLEDEFEVSGYTYKCGYEYPTSFIEVTMRGKPINLMKTRLEPEVHDMFIRLIRRWNRKAEDGVFYGMQIVWGVNVTHCLDVEELYKLLVQGHLPVQYVNGPYTKALVMGEREILASFINVIITITSCFGVMYVNYGGHVVINGMAFIFLLIVGGLHIRTLHLCTYTDVESRIFSYKYLRCFKYLEYWRQVLCPHRYCMEVMGHPVHVEGGKCYAELTRSDPDSNSIFAFESVPLFRVEIGKCLCSVIRFPKSPDYVSFYIVSKVHNSKRYSRSYTRCMSETCQQQFITLLTRWGEGTISFISSTAIKGGQRSGHCTSLLDIFKWFADDPYRSLDEISACRAYRIRKLGDGFENGLWLVHDG